MGNVDVRDNAAVLFFFSFKILAGIPAAILDVAQARRECLPRWLFLRIRGLPFFGPHAGCARRSLAIPCAYGHRTYAPTYVGW